jgi:6-phosphogluconolactonase
LTRRRSKVNHRYTAGVKSPRWLLLALLAGCATGSGAGAEHGPAASAGPAYVYAGGPGGEIAVFKLDRISGKLAQHGSVPAGRAGALVADGRGRFLYVASDGEVAAFAIRPKNGSLQSLGRAPAKGAGTNDLVIHHNGKYLLATNERSGNVVVFNVRTDGGLGPAEAYGAGPSPQAVALNPALDFAFVLNPATVTQFVFNTGTGILTPSRERPFALPARSNPRRLTFHPSGRFAYFIEEGTGNIAGYAFEPTSGTLSVLAFQTISMLPGGKTGKLRGGDLRVTSSGKFLYAVDRSQDKVAVFKVDAETGGLTLVEHDDAGGRQPRALAIIDGKLNPIVLVAHERSLSSFNVDPATGSLRAADSAPLHSAPAALAVAAVE